MEHAVDVIVIGGGHAGCEAAAAAARRGARTMLVTHRIETVGAMSCNPAIGGLGKGHLVREVDALDGLIARAGDAAAIHYRMLNASKGAAVRGPRVQADRTRFAAAIQTLLAGYATLEVVAGEVSALVIEADRVTGVRLADGSVLAARAVVLATGTFLNGRLHCGPASSEGGRAGDPAAMDLGAQLRAFGLPIGRLKTGTPPRLEGRTIDWSRLERQPSDARAWCLSPMTGRRKLPQLACAITRTNPHTHAIVRRALDRSPLRSGAIEGRGPRYCPSIEDKIARFADRESHQIFLEPEGLDDPLVYPNGISTSLPADAQAEMVASVAGLERARIVRPGYAVDYDFLDPRSLDRRLESRAVCGLFCAGQINGTTGYEEAAAQGLVAGLNAAASACDLPPAEFDRANAYLGVLIDDLIVAGVTEPYRMLTARAEYRLSLRADNAMERLTPLGIALGCVSAERAAVYERDAEALGQAKQTLETRVSADAVGLEGAAGGSLADWSARGRSSDDLRAASPDLAALPEDVVDRAIEDLRYAPYVERQRAEVAAMRTREHRALDPMLDYRAIPGLSTEMIERLEMVRPPTLGLAARIPGVTPTAVALLMAHGARRAA